MKGNIVSENKSFGNTDSHMQSEGRAELLKVLPQRQGVLNMTFYAAKVCASLCVQARKPTHLEATQTPKEAQIRPLYYITCYHSMLRTLLLLLLLHNMLSFIHSCLNASISCWRNTL